MNDNDRQELLAQLEHLKSLAERAYGDMYETGSASGAAACYSEARVCYRDAIRVAAELDLPHEAETLNQQMGLLAAAFRGQFG
jgi:hypothetical protein